MVHYIHWGWLFNFMHENLTGTDVNLLLYFPQLTQRSTEITPPTTWKITGQVYCRTKDYIVNSGTSSSISFEDNLHLRVL